MKLVNSWKRWKYLDKQTEAECDLVDVASYAAVLEKAGALEAYFHRDGTTPCVGAIFPRLVTPTIALELGSALAKACSQPIRLIFLKPRAIEFAVEGRFLLPDGTEYAPDHFSDYGERISTLAAAWSTSTGRVA